MERLSYNWTWFRKRQILLNEGYPILHFSGSEINHNVQNCIETIKSSVTSLSVIASRSTLILTNPKRRLKNSYLVQYEYLHQQGQKDKNSRQRVVNLINNGIPPERILALAFNKKASEEMKLRLVNKQITDVEVLTFHSLGLRIVRDALHWSFDGQNEKAGTRDLISQAVQKHIQFPIRGIGILWMYSWTRYVEQKWNFPDFRSHRRSWREVFSFRTYLQIVYWVAV